VNHRTAFFRNARAALLALCSVPLIAHAGREILLDVPGSDYSLNGQSWGAYSSSTTFSNTLGGILIGSSETLLASGTATYPSTAFFISPLALGSGQYVLNPGDSLSAIGINIGKIDPKVFDPSIVDDRNYNLATSFNAARYNFNDVCLTSACTTSLTFQVIDVRLSATVDVLEFNYAIGAIPAGATSGFLAGPYSASFSATTAPAFCLNNGAQTAFTSIASCLGTTVVTTVPEPDVASLFLLGGLGLAGFALARKRRPVRVIAR
jgi:hypothetical protein